MLNIEKDKNLVIIINRKSNGDVNVWGIYYEYVLAEGQILDEDQLIEIIGNV